MNSDKEYAEQVLRILKRLVESDGVVTPEEATWMTYIRQHLGQTGDSQPFDPNKLKAAVENKGEAEELISLLLMVSLADGKTAHDELEIVRHVAELVEVPEARVEELKADVIENLGL